MAEKEKKSDKKSKKHKVKSMHVRKADSGGFIARHDEMIPGEDGSMPPQQEHILPDMASLQQHMGDHMGDDEAAEGEAK